MKRNLKKLIGFTMGATDGEIGKVRDLYFDDRSWMIRYLVVETGGWLSGRRVLISPQAVNGTDWQGDSFPVNLTKEQVKNSPDIDTEPTVSRQHEIELYRHYPWTHYWAGGLWGGGIGTAGMMTGAAELSEENLDKRFPEEEKHEESNHLCSFANVKGYMIHETDGHIGEVEDFIMDDQSWQIDFLVVDTGTWLPGKKVLVTPQLIRNIDWLTTTVTVEASKDKIRHCPAYEPDKMDTGEYQRLLQDYHEHLV